MHISCALFSVSPTWSTDLQKRALAPSEPKWKPSTARIIPSALSPNSVNSIHVLTLALALSSVFWNAFERKRKTDYALFVHRCIPVKLIEMFYQKCKYGLIVCFPFLISYRNGPIPSRYSTAKEKVNEGLKAWCSRQNAYSASIRTPALLKMPSMGNCFYVLVLERQRQVTSWSA